jgi:hypothetical protein
MPEDYPSGFIEAGAYRDAHPMEGFGIAGLFKLMLHGDDHKFFAKKQGLRRCLKAGAA